MLQISSNQRLEQTAFTSVLCMFAQLWQPNEGQLKTMDWTLAWTLDWTLAGLWTGLY